VWTIYLPEGGGAVAVPGLGIFVDIEYWNSLSTDSRMALLKHEFGHIRQYKELGPAVYTFIAACSLTSATFCTAEEHDNMPWEKDANNRSERYFEDVDRSPKLSRRLRNEVEHQ